MVELYHFVSYNLYCIKMGNILTKNAFKLGILRKIELEFEIPCNITLEWRISWKNASNGECLELMH